MNPLAPIALAVILGVILLTFLISRGWFTVFRKENPKGLIFWLGLAALFALLTISVDLNVVFPADINVSFPESLLYYPVMGFFVEISQHVLPLSLMLVILTSLSKKLDHNTMIWASIFVVALIEPIFQVVAGFSEPQSMWTNLFVGLNLHLFGLSQLVVFRRYGFVGMYSMRLVYYLLWHVIWGFFRLDLLF